MTVRTFTFPVTAPQVGLPSYVPTTPYQVAALSTVTNNKPTWYSAADVAWDVTPPRDYSVRNVSNFSGGFSDPDRRYLYAHGGGHGDSAYNGILRFDLNGTTQAAGWTEIAASASTISNVPMPATPSTAADNFFAYLDGKAGSIHSYDNMVFDPTSNSLYRFGGSYWSYGSAPGNNANWKFNFSTGQWTRLGAMASGFNVDYASVYDPVTRKAMIWRGSGTAQFYRVATEANGATFSPPAGAYDAVGAYDPTRNRVLHITNGTLQHTTVNWSGESITGWVNFTATGDTATLLDEGMAIWYDALLDRFWFLGARRVEITKIYWIAASDFSDNAVTVNSVPLLNTSGQAFTIPSTGGSSPGRFDGLYKRFCWIPEWRAVAVATSYNYPVHVIKLPSA
jgi:hypothetical protein